MQMPLPIDRFKASLAQVADDARAWFEHSSSPLSRHAFEGRSAKGTAPRAAVYVYYGSEGVALYVGQSGRAVKARLYDQTSPHARKSWWKDWTSMRHLTLADETDRLVLELALIIAYAPPHNSKPAGKHVSSLFAL
jgi:hypothetical protein